LEASIDYGVPIATLYDLGIIAKTNISCIGSEETRRDCGRRDPRQKLSLIVKVISSDGHSESLMRKLSKKRTIENGQRFIAGIRITKRT